MRDRPQRRPRRGFRRLAARRRRRAARAGHQRERRLRLPRRRPVDHGAGRVSRPPSARVSIGAQVGYRDLVGFGRRRDRRRPGRPLRRRALPARRAGRLRPRRPAPGCGTSSRTARCTAPCGRRPARPTPSPPRSPAYDPTLPLLGPPGSALAAAARSRAGVGFVAEGFADRAYQPDGRLVPRSRPGAVLRRPGRRGRAGGRARDRDRVTRGRRQRDRGAAESICVHGDSPGAVATARAVRARPADAGRRPDAVRAVRTLPYGGDAVLRRTGRTARRRLAAAAAPAADAAIAEVVPAARTVLVRFVPGRPRPRPRGAARRGPTSVRRRPPTAPPCDSRCATTGPTSTHVADELGLSREALVARHAGAEYTVAFCGFAPGFGYLDRPARGAARAAAATSRARACPAGAVGIAGAVHRRLPAALPRRLAAARPHRRRALGPRRATRRPSSTPGRPVRFRRADDRGAGARAADDRPGRAAGPATPRSAWRARRRLRPRGAAAPRTGSSATPPAPRCSS